MICVHRIHCSVVVVVVHYYNYNYNYDYYNDKT